MFYKKEIKEIKKIKSELNEAISAIINQDEKIKKLIFEVKNPPNFSKGEKVCNVIIIDSEITRINSFILLVRIYKCFNETTKTIMDISEIDLLKCKEENKIFT